MRFFINVCIVLALVTCFTGCVRKPQPEGYSLTSQQKMQAAHHWNVLANDVANRINNDLIRREYFETPVYVRHSCGEPGSCGEQETFPFDEGFHDLLTTQLVNFGVPTIVEEDPAGLIVEYKTQVLYSRSADHQWPRPGSLTALTAGIVVFRNAPAEIAAIIAAAALDATRTTDVVNGHYEVIITTSIVRDNVYLMRTSDIYYISDDDYWHYRQAPPAAEIRLTSSGS